eukprot:6184201-Pleurochrysis_carterae.AAC.1
MASIQGFTAKRLRGIRYYALILWANYCAATARGHQQTSEVLPKGPFNLDVNNAGAERLMVLEGMPVSGCFPRPHWQTAESRDAEDVPRAAAASSDVAPEVPDEEMPSSP